MKRLAACAGVTLALLALGLFVNAQIDLIPFTAGEVIRAEEVNQNFQSLAEAIEAGQLPIDCEAGEVAEWDGSGWTCAPDDVGEGGGGGDITGVSAGTGLAGGGDSGSVTLSVAPAFQLPQECSSGQVLRFLLNGADTFWHCSGETSYAAGEGLSLIEGQFSVNFAGSGSTMTAARSDHEHMGQTWVGESPLILEAPAAFSTTTGGVLVLRNTGTSGAGLLVSDSGDYGLWVRSAEDTGLVIDSAGRNGIYAFAEEYGAELHGRDAGLLVGGSPSTSTGIVPDIILGGNSCFPCGDEDDDGRIYSDPSRTSSDIFLVSNDAVVVQLDANNDEAGHFQVQNHTGAAVFQVAEDGTVSVTGTTVHSSDREQKTGVEAVDPAEILSRVATLPISRWRYRQNEAVPHLGPMAQDFYAAFGLGSDETAIAAVDADGVALAAIQGLYQLLQEKDAQIAELELRLQRLEAER